MTSPLVGEQSNKQYAEMGFGLGDGESLHSP